jgi:CHAD domain-containing protein
VEFQQQIPVYRKKGKKAGRHLLADVQNINTGCIRDWYAARLIKISVLLTASGDLLHEARKKIKELLYVQGLLPKELVEEIGLDRGYLDELQGALGQWHDMAVIATAYASRDGADGRAMFEECKKKEAVVRALAKDFYRRAHES